MKKYIIITVLMSLLSACSPKNEQNTNFETKIEAIASFTDTSTALADFGNPVTASTTRIFTFKNIGDTSGPGTATLTGTNSTSFSIILQTGCATVNVGSTCTVRVNFNPSGKAVGSYTADLNIGGTVLKTLTATVAAATTGGSTTGGSTGGTTGGTTSGGSGTIEASISGVVISNPLDYGSFTGTQTATKIITLKNTGTTSTGPHTAALSDTDFTFTLNSCSNKTLAPNGTCSVRVTFNATSKTAQEYLTDLNFGSATFPLKATVAGAGTTTGGSTGGTTGGTTSGGAAVISFLDGTTPINSPYSIGSTTTTSITKIITIKNTGTVSTGPHTAALSDTDITFVLNSCSNKTLAAGGSCTVRVTFNPSGKTSGEHSSTLTFGTGSIDLTATKSGAGAITYTSIYSNYSGCTVTQACQGSGIESRTLTACEQYTDGVLTNPTAPLGSCSTTALTRSCQSPPGDVIVTTGLPTGYDSRSVTCAAGQTVAQGTITDVTCSTTHFKTGTTCSPNVITYTAEYSDYGTCSVTEPCVGIGLETRTYSCRQYTNGVAGALLDSSNCSPSESLTRACNGPTGSVTITTGLPTGMDSRTILCLDGQTLAQGSVTAISCSSNYNQQGLSCILNQHSLSVSKTRSGGGTITSQPAGINCGGDCSFSFDYGTVITLTQTVETGYVFSGWTGACAGTGACSVNLDSNKTVGMNIDCAVGYHDEAGYCVEDVAIQYTLNVNNSPYGTITGDAPGTANDFVCDGTCSGVIKTLNANDLVTLTFIPNNYYTFVSWGGNCASNPCVLNMNTNLIITPPTVDPILPSSLTLMINTGEATTTNSSATLNIAAVDATEMAISTTTCDTSTNAAWEPYATTKAVTLVNGLNEFFVAFRNPATASSTCAQASITKNSSGGGTDTTPPQLLVYGPQSFAPISTGVSVEFNEDIDGTTVNGDTFKICTNGGLTCSIPSTLTQVSARRFVLTPNSLLTKDVTYTVKIGQGATPIKDLALNDFAGHSWEFTAQQGWLTYSVPSGLSSGNFQEARTANGIVFYLKDNEESIFRNGDIVVASKQSGDYLREAFTNEDNTKIFLLIENGSNNNHRILSIDSSTMEIEDTISLSGIYYGQNIYITRKGYLYWFQQDSNVSGQLLIQVAVFNPTNNVFSPPATIYTAMSNQVGSEFYNLNINEIGDRISFGYITYTNGPVDYQVNLITCNLTTCSQELVETIIVDQSGVNHYVNGTGSIHTGISSSGNKIVIVWEEFAYQAGVSNQTDIKTKVKINGSWHPITSPETDETLNPLTYAPRVGTGVVGIESTGNIFAIYRQSDNFGNSTFRYKLYDEGNQTWPVTYTDQGNPFLSGNYNNIPKVVNFTDNSAAVIFYETDSQNLYLYAMGIASGGAATTINSVGSYSDTNSMMMGFEIIYAIDNTVAYVLFKNSSGISFLGTVQGTTFSGGLSELVSGIWATKFDGIGLPPVNSNYSLGYNPQIFDIDNKSGAVVARINDSVEDNLYLSGTEVAYITKYNWSTLESFDADIAANGDVVMNLVSKQQLYYNSQFGGDCNFIYSWSAVYDNSSGSWTDYLPLASIGSGQGCYSGGTTFNDTFRTYVLNVSSQNQTSVQTNRSDNMSAFYSFGGNAYSHSLFDWGGSISYSSIDNYGSQVLNYQYLETAAGNYMLNPFSSSQPVYFYSAYHDNYSPLSGEAIFDLDNQDIRAILYAPGGGEIRIEYNGNSYDLKSLGVIPSNENLNGIYGGGYVDAAGTKAVFIFGTSFNSGDPDYISTYKLNSVTLDTSTLMFTHQELSSYNSLSSSYENIQKVVLGKMGSHYLIMNDNLNNQYIRKFNYSNNNFDSSISMPVSGFLAGTVDLSNNLRVVSITSSNLYSRYFNSSNNTWENSELVASGFNLNYNSGIDKGIKVKRDGTIVITEGNGGSRILIYK